MGKTNPCEICGEPSFSVVINKCKRCYNLNSVIDNFLSENFDSATDFLLEKLSIVAKKRLQKKRRNYIESLNLKHYKLPEPIKNAPNILHVTIVSTSVINRLTSKFVSSGTHIQLLDDIEFQKLHRSGLQLLCKPGYIQKNSHKTKLNLSCNQCIKMAKSLEKRDIKIIYLAEEEAVNYNKRILT